jgi:hypothetical protein
MKLSTETIGILFLLKRCSHGKENFQRSKKSNWKNLLPTSNNLSFSIRPFKQYCVFQCTSQQLMWRICLLTAISANFGKTHPLAGIKFFENRKPAHHMALPRFQQITNDSNEAGMYNILPTVGLAGMVIGNVVEKPGYEVNVLDTGVAIINSLVPAVVLLV